jgi:hypothetical protein
MEPNIKYAPEAPIAAIIFVRNFDTRKAQRNGILKKESLNHF